MHGTKTGRRPHIVDPSLHSFRRKAAARTSTRHLRMTGPDMGKNKAVYLSGGFTGLEEVSLSVGMGRLGRPLETSCSGTGSGTLLTLWPLNFACQDGFSGAKHGRPCTPAPVLEPHSHPIRPNIRQSPLNTSDKRSDVYMLGRVVYTLLWATSWTVQYF